MNKKLLATAAACLLSSVAFAAPAAAQPATECAGDLGAVTVGSLTVPEGAACVLDGTKVIGGVSVAAGAEFIAYNSRIRHGVAANGSALVELEGGFVGGAVSAADTGLVRLTDTVVIGTVAARGQALVSLNTSTVGGSVVAERASSLLVFDTAVIGSLKSSTVYYGTQVCGSGVGGDLRVTTGSSAIAVGGTDTCAANTVFGSVVVDDNTASGITVGGNTVLGNLSCAGNTPEPAGSGNRVRGVKSGQCAAL